jgi:SOS response regulatory protein OraA/RecX
MSSWSKLNHSLLREVEFFWRGQKVGYLPSPLARLLQFPLEEAACIDSAFDQFKQQAVEAGYRWCLERLAAQNQSRKQLFQKLRQKKVDLAMVELILQRVEQSGYLNEEALGQSLEEKGRQARKSHRFVEQALKSKGLDFSQLDWKEVREQDLENAYYWLDRWGQKEDIRPHMARYMSRLASRGFDFEICQQAWQHWLNENASKIQNNL